MVFVQVKARPHLRNIGGPIDGRQSPCPEKRRGFRDLVEVAYRRAWNRFDGFGGPSDASRRWIRLTYPQVGRFAVEKLA